MKKRLFTKALTCSLVFSLLLATPALADFSAPTNPTVISNDYNVIKVTNSHYPADQLEPLILGADMVSTSTLGGLGDPKVILGIFGTGVNSNPDPFLTNYFYNNYYASSHNLQTVTPAMIVGTATDVNSTYNVLNGLVNRPQIILSNDASTFNGAIAALPENTDSSSTNDYKPSIVSLTGYTTVADQITDMKKLAEEMNQVIKASNGKLTTRYGDPAIIASDYEKFYKGLKYYAMGEIDKMISSGKLAKKKTVAVVYSTTAANAGENDIWQCSTAQTTNGTSLDRASQYCEGITTNLADLIRGKDSSRVFDQAANKDLNITIASTGLVKVTTDELTQADVIITGGKNTTNNDGVAEPILNALEAKGYKADQIPEMFEKLPLPLYNLLANSIENALGNSFVAGNLYYNEGLDMNPVYTTAYFLQKFYHLTDNEALQQVVNETLKDATLPEGLTTDLTNYDPQKIEKMIVKGAEYAKQYDPSWQPDFSVGIGSDLDDNGDNDVLADRIYGESRYDTAVEIAKNYFADGADTVVLTRGDVSADALPAVPLAKKLNAPLLLTQPDSLSDNVLQEIKSLGAKKVVIIGGPGAVKSAVEDKLTANGLQVERVYGQTQYDTAYEIAKQLGGSTGQAVLVNGNLYKSTFPDALSVSSWAGYNSVPILYVDSSSSRLPEATSKAISEMKINKTLLVGGTAVVPSALESLVPNPQRYGGTTLYDTNVQVLKTLQPNATSVYAVTGKDFADALAGAAVAARSNGWLLLTGANATASQGGLTLDQQTLLESTNGKVTSFHVFGGPAVVSQSTLEAVKSMLGK